MISQPDNDDVLSTFNYLPWRKRQLEKNIDLGQAAKDIENNLETIVTMPNIDDKILGMNGLPSEFFRYERDKDGKPTRDGLIDYRKDEYRAIDLIADRRKEKELLCARYVSAMTNSVKIYLGSVPEFVESSRDRDSFKMWKAIEKSRSEVGPRVIRHRTKAFMNLSQGTNSHEHFVDQLRTAENDFTNDFGGSGTYKGWAKISHIVGMIYIGGVDQDVFNFKLETTLNEHPTCKLDDPWATVAAFQQYSLGKQMVGPTAEEPASSLASITSSPAPTLPSKVCVSCKAPFVPYRPAFKFCNKCNKANQLSNSTQTPATRPAHKKEGGRGPSDNKSPMAARSLAAATTTNAEDEVALQSARALIAASDIKARASASHSTSSAPSSHAVRAAQLFIQKTKLRNAEALIAAAADVGFDYALSDDDVDDFESYTSLIASFTPSDLAVTPLCFSPVKSHCPKAAPLVTHTDPWFADNAASYSTTNDPNMLESITAIEPFPIGGIGSGVIATHTGFLKFLPREIAKCYLTPSTRINLLSLGYLNSKGASYHTVGATLVVRYKNKTLFSSPRVQNNLTPVPSYLLTSQFCSEVTNKTSFYPLLLASQKKSFASTTKHFTKEERARAEEAEHLHVYLHHASDERVASALSNGNFPSSHLTRADVYNNRELRGPCPQCLQAKLKQRSMPNSITPPAADPGVQLSVDLSKLSTPSPGGNTQKLIVVDEKTGRVDVFGAKSKSSDCLFTTLLEAISEYNSRGFRVSAIHADAESALVSLKTRLNLIGIRLSLSPPQQHAQRVERYIQTINDRSRATLAGLDFVLPPKYLLHCSVDAANAMNLLTNSRTDKSTPFELTSKTKAKFHTDIPFLRFGATAMVLQDNNKRSRIAKSLQYPRNSTPKAELGVCMGSDNRFPGSYLFCIANGLVVPRRVISVVNTIPFDWKRQSVITSTIAPPSAIHLVSETHPSPTHINNLLQPTEHHQDFPIFLAPQATPPVISIPKLDTPTNPDLPKSELSSVNPPAPTPLISATEALPPPPAQPIVIPPTAPTPTVAITNQPTPVVAPRARRSTRDVGTKNHDGTVNRAYISRPTRMPAAMRYAVDSSIKQDTGPFCFLAHSDPHQEGRMYGLKASDHMFALEFKK